MLALRNFMKLISSLAATCEGLDAPANGQVDVTTLYQGSVATYTCDPTYKLNGDPERTCESSGEWSGVEPSCTRRFHH